MPNMLPEGEQEFRVALGRRIRAAIDNTGLPASQVAETTGIQIPNMSRYLRGLRPVPANVLAKLATVCGVTLDELCDVGGPPMRKPSRSGRCMAQMVHEETGPGYKVTLTLSCNVPDHDGERHHDPRGFTWEEDRAR